MHVRARGGKNIQRPTTITPRMLNPEPRIILAPFQRYGCQIMSLKNTQMFTETDVQVT